MSRRGEGDESRMAGPTVKFTVAPKVIVASLELKGSYAGVGGAMKQLKAWIDSKGIEQVGYPFCTYFDNPTETAEAELRSEVCIPVAKAFTGEGRFQVKELQEMEVAETRHQGPPEQFATTYGPFLEGLLKGGYRLLGPAREYYMTVSDVTGPGAGFLIHQPVAKS
jgi:effector-binding domain-containing protein